MYSCYQKYTNKDIIEFLRKQGLEVKEERGNRIFPVTDKSQDVLKCFTKKLKENRVKILYNMQVQKILVDEQKEKAIGILANNEEMYADKIILATGGKSYPLTGSTGDGYKMVEELGHTCNKNKTIT